MAAIDFPSSPTTGQQFSAVGLIWTFDGTKWTATASTTGIPDAPNDGQLYGRQSVSGSMSWSVAGTGGGTITAGTTPTSGFTANQLIKSDGTVTQASVPSPPSPSVISLGTVSQPIYLNSFANGGSGGYNDVIFSTSSGGSSIGVGIFVNGGNTPGAARGVGVDSYGFFGFTTGTNTVGPTPDVAFVSDNQNGVAKFRNLSSPTSPISLRAYNTFTDNSNGEWGALDWQTTPNVLTIGAQANGTGTARDVNVVAGAHLKVFSSGTQVLDFNATIPGTWNVNSGGGIACLGGTGYLGSASYPWGSVNTNSLTVNGPAHLKVQNVTASATTTIDRNSGENVALTLGVAITTFNISNWPASGLTGKLRLVINNTGGNTIAWPAATKWPGGTAPTLSASGKTDIILLMSDNGGTTIYGSVVGQDYR